MEKKEVRGVRIKTICCGLLLLAGILFILLIGGLINITSSYRELRIATESYMNAENNIRLLDAAHIRLSDAAKQYVTTLDGSCLDTYFAESDNSEEKDNAIAELSELAKGKRSLRLTVEDVIADYEQLAQIETHAMRLASAAAGTAPEDLPAALAAEQLTEEELSYDKKEQQEQAYEMLFGSDYEQLMQKISEEQGDAADQISAMTKQEQLACEEELSVALTSLQVYIALLLVLAVIIFVILLFFVVRPVNRYVKCIAEEKDMDVKGLYEFKVLAYTYNKTRSRTREKTHALKKTAEHDALTGIWNRATFEQLKDDFSKSFEPLTLLLIDVDNFKGVNDNYGHEIGDHALKRVADLLKEQFRSNDYPLRIGGDEFAVLMVNATPREKAVIRQKLTFINDTLAKGSGDIPPLSLSVGVAFSESGYSDELFQKADAALYRTKENGKHGFTFHGEYKN